MDNMDLDYYDDPSWYEDVDRHWYESRGSGPVLVDKHTHWYLVKVQKNDQQAADLLDAFYGYKLRGTLESVRIKLQGMLKDEVKPDGSDYTFTICHEDDRPPALPRDVKIRY